MCYKYYICLCYTNGKSVWSWCDGLSDRSFMVDTVSYFSFQSVHHDLCNKEVVSLYYALSVSKARSRSVGTVLARCAHIAGSIHPNQHPKTCESKTGYGLCCLCETAYKKYLATSEKMVVVLNVVCENANDILCAPSHKHDSIYPDLCHIDY